MDQKHHSVSLTYKRGANPAGGFKSDLTEIKIDGAAQLIQKFKMEIDAATQVPVVSYEVLPSEIKLELDGVLLTSDLDKLADTLDKLPLDPMVLGVDVFADRLRRLADRISPREA